VHSEGKGPGAVRLRTGGIQPDAITLEVKGQLQEIPNDFVWIFASGDFGG